jgi:hypothetical protein
MPGISYPTIKQWILAGKLKTRLTPGRHHRVATADLKPFLAKEGGKDVLRTRERFGGLSGRNQLIGPVLEVKIEGLMQHPC